MCDCFHLSLPNWHATPAGGRRLQGREPGTEDDSLYDEPSQLVEEKRPRPQGSSPVEEFPEAATFSDSDKEGGTEHDLQKKGGKGGKRSGLGSLFDKRSTSKMSKLKEVHSPESEVIVKTAQDGGAEGLIVGGGGREGIFIKQVVPESPAYKNLCVKEGDQILSATVYFDNVTYEDALQIMEHAQAYKVKLCLKRKPEVPEEDLDGHPETIQEEEVPSPEMRGQRKTKRHSDARISWPKFPSLGKGRKKSHFRRSHSTSEAEDQTKLELSPTTSDTDSPIKSQDALKGKKRHKVKLNLLKNKGGISAYADQDTDTLTTVPLNGVNEDPTKEVSPPDSPELLDVSPPVYFTHQFKIPESCELKVEQGIADMAEPESPHHKVELICVDSTLKTADLTVALAGQDSPTAHMSPNGKKKKKKEKSELKMKIKGKDKSHKQDAKMKSSPKRLQTLGASIEIPDPTANKNLDATKKVSSQVELPQVAINTDTQLTAGKGFEVISAPVPTQEEKDLPKVEFSFDVSDVGILKKSPRIGKEKPKKEAEKVLKGSKQKTDTKKSPFKLPTVGFTDIAMEDIIEKTDVKDKQDSYDRLSCPSKRQLPKREEMEIPGMEDASSAGRKKQGIKDPKGLAMNGIEELHAETVQMSIDVKSVKEAVSKLPGFKLPKVDMEGVPILEEITMIDANAQRITVKTQGTPTKMSHTKTKEDPIQLQNIKAENLVPHDIFTETKVEMDTENKAMGNLSSVDTKTEGHKREDILIPGEESRGEETQGHETKEDAFERSSGTNPGQNKANNKDLTSPKKNNEGKKLTTSFGVAKTDIRFPNVAIDLPKLNLSENKSIGSSVTKLKMTTIGATTNIANVQMLNVDQETETLTPAVNTVSTLNDGEGPPKVMVDITSPKVEVEGPSIDLESTGPDGVGKGSKIKMPSLGLSMPKLKEPDIDFSVSKPDVDITSPKARADIALPDVEVPSAKIEVKGSEIETEDFDVSSKFKMPKFKLPKFGIGSSSITAEIPAVDKQIIFDAELTIPKATVDITSPKVEVEGPSVDLESTGPDGMGKGSKMKMPSLGLSMPKVKGPEVDFNVSKPEVDITLPEKVALPDVELPSTKVEVKGPEIDLKVKDGIDGTGKGSTFKMPNLGISIPKVKGPDTDFSVSKPDVDITSPKAKADIALPDVELNIPKATVDITSPKVEVEGPSIDLESTGPDGMGKGSKIKMPSLGLSMPKVKGPEVDFNVSKPEVDITLPEKVALPDIELPSTKVEVKGPEIDLKGKDVDITSPKVEVEGPSIDLESTGPDGMGKGSKMKMPSLGLSMPKVKGPEVDFNVSKPEVDITLPEKVALPDVELPSTKVEVKGPEIDLKVKDGKGSPSKFKMPTFKFPKFGAASPNISVEIPEVEKEITFDGELNIPEARVEITAPNVDIEGPSIDLKSTGIDEKVALPDIELPSTKVEVKGPEIDLKVKDGKGSPSKFKMPTFKFPKFGAASPNISFKMPNLGISIPKVKGPDIDFSVSKPDVNITSPKAKADVTLPDVELPSAKIEVKGPEIETEDFDGSSKFKMPRFKLPKFGIGSSSITAEIPAVDKKIIFDAELNIPKATVDITSPKVEVEGPSIDLESTGPDGMGKGSKMKMPSLGLSMPKVKGPEVDFNVSKPEVDITLPEKVALPDIELPSTKVEVKGPEIDLKVKDARVEITAPNVDIEGPSIDLKSTGIDGTAKGSKFKMPNLGISMPKVEGPDIDFSVSKPDVDITSPKAKADVTLPDVEVPSAKIEVKGPEIETEDFDAKGSKFKMPNLGISMPKVKGPDIDFSVSKPDVDITSPKAKADIALPDVEVPSAKIEVKGPEIETEDFDGSSKFKMPRFKLPKFGIGSSSITAEIPAVDKQIIFDAELNIPKATVDITSPKVEVEGPSIDLESTGPDGMGKGSKIKMPSLGLSMPKVKGPEVDFNVSKPEVDITLPEKVALPDAELPSTKVEVKGPEIDLKVKDGKGSLSKFKMPTLKFPKFGAASPNISVEIPEVEKEITFDGELNIPEARVEITAPNVDIEGASTDLKSTGIDGTGKGSKFKMPNLGISIPIVKGPDIDFSVSKPDVDITSPKAKADVTLPDVEVPSAKIEVKAPEIETEDVDGPDGMGKGSKMKIPSLGLSMPKVKGPEVDFNVSKPEVDITLPEKVTLPDAELPSTKVEVKGPEIDLKVKDGKGSLSKFKMPTLKFPKFGAASPNISVEIPEVEKEITFDGELNIPEARVEITAPNVDIEGASTDLKSTGIDGTGKGSKFKMPNLGISIPKVKGPDIDFSVSKPDVDITSPKAKADVTLPDVEVPSAKIEVKGPEIETEDFDVSSKFKKSKFKLPKFGIGSSSITAEIPEVDRKIKFDEEVNIPQATVDFTSPKVEVEGPSVDLESKGPDGMGKGSKIKMPSLGLSMPKVKGPEVDFNVSKPEVDITLPEKVTLPDIELPSTKVEVKGPEIDLKVKDGKGSPSKFKMPTFKFPKFGAASPNMSVEIPEVEKEITFDGELNIPETRVEITAPNVDIEGPSMVVELPSTNVEVKGPEIETEDFDGSSKFKMPKFKLPKFGTGSSSITAEIPEGKEDKVDMEVRKASATLTSLEDCTLEEDVKGKKPWFSLPRFSFSKQSVKETDYQSPEMETVLNPAEGSGIETNYLASPIVTEEVMKHDKEVKTWEPTIPVGSKVTSQDVKTRAPNAEIQTSKPNCPDDIKFPSHDMKTVAPNADSRNPETASPVNGSPSKFKLPSFKMPKLSFSRAKPEDEYLPVDTDFKGIRRSLRFSKKDKEKDQKKEREEEVILSELPEEKEKKEVVDKREEISESYTLPEVLPTPLSVMEINKLIKMEILEEAHLNLLSLRQNFQEEQCGEEKGSMELSKKEKDLHLLYRELRDKVKAIVRDSSDSGLLVGVARIVQEEERREGEPGGLAVPGGWREIWREAVGQGVLAMVASVPLDGPDQNSAWLMVHLGLLGQTIVQDLEKVKRDLRGSYPPSFKVFSTYVRSYHLVVGQHLKKLQQQVKELKDHFALLDWILNSYQSETIMGSSSLQPEMQSETVELVLDQGFLDQLRDQSCSRLQIDIRFSLGEIIKMEKEFWRERNSYEVKEGFLSSPTELDIRTRVQGIVTGARRVDTHLELKAIHSCCEELKLFPKSFEAALMSSCSSAEVNPLTATLRATYLITSINTFISVQQHMEQHRASCPGPVAEFNQEVDSLLGRLAHSLEEQYKNDIKPYMGRMMTRKWLTNDEDFQRLYKRMEQLSEQCSQMRPPTVQGLVDRLHHHTVKDYISQLMKNSYSCKNRKHKRGATKLRKQWGELGNLFTDMKSTHDWLHPLGDLLSNIIGGVDKRDIKNHLRPLVEQYPDMREKHLAAVLYFRGLSRSHERQAILQHFSELRKTAASRAARASNQSLFRDMQLTGNTDWLAQLPFTCLAFLRSDS
ncbi:unnamed protein product [Lota lota]